MASFLVLALLSCWALPIGTPAVACLLLLLGVGIEVLQGLVPAGRAADPADVGADVIGLAVGLVVWSVALALHRRMGPAIDEPMER